MTSDVPAILNGSEVANHLTKLDAATEWVRTAGGDDAAGTAEQARQVYAYLKAVGAAVELGIAAARLECTALRRLGQLDAEHVLLKMKNGAERANIAKSFAAMTDLRFNALMAGINRYVTAVGVHRALRREESAKEWEEYGGAIGSGGAVGQPLGGDALADLAEAAGALLNEFAPQGRPFTVAEVAQKLAEEWGGGWSDQATRLGYMTAVRQALRSEGMGGGRRPDFMHECLPDWITYREDLAGWVRIPVHVASLEQFQAMVALRRAQLADLTDVVESLSLALEDLEAVAEDQPDLLTLRALSLSWRNGDLRRFEGAAVAS